MDSIQSSMNLKVIGFVKNGILPANTQAVWQDTISEIEINPEYVEATENLNDFSHLIILFWLNRSERESTPLKIHPKRNPALPIVGLFATRSPDRPNPIGVTTVQLISRVGNILKVKGLDAFDGSPVIDIKPYIPGNDCINEAKVPRWINKAHEKPY
jgi:tRNA-Thr(GGU) m(6)t(6)A37 methyltransferase TsaA